MWSTRNIPQIENCKICGALSLMVNLIWHATQAIMDYCFTRDVFILALSLFVLRFLSKCMRVQLQAILAIIRLWQELRQISFGMGCTPLFEISSASATYVNAIKLRTYHLLGCYNHYQIIMDFIDALPLSQGRNVIMVVVGRLSKYAHFISLSHPYTAAAIARQFSRSCVQATWDANLCRW